MDKIELKVTGISYSKAQTGAYALILSEVNGKKKLPIMIGGYEAQAIALALENMITNRPLTHDLLKNTLESLNTSLKEVIIYKIEEGVFFSKLILSNNQTGEITEIEARPSDAIAIAVRTESPIYASKSVIDSTGIALEDLTQDDDPMDIGDETEILSSEKDSENDLSLKTTDELTKMLEIALENEEYEFAAKIRDEINSRKS